MSLTCNFASHGCVWYVHTLHRAYVSVPITIGRFVLSLGFCAPAIATYRHLGHVQERRAARATRKHSKTGKYSRGIPKTTYATSLPSICSAMGACGWLVQLGARGVQAAAVAQP